jgi:RimJ/RimL family protein N-acetyltransferase
MHSSFYIVVRKMKVEDISLIADYWLKSYPEFLENIGVDLKKLPSRKTIIETHTKEINDTSTDQNKCAVVWEFNKRSVGHSIALKNSKTANMHLHLWDASLRKKGLGTAFVQKTIAIYFQELQIDTLICEPKASNLAANKTLEKVGFRFLKKYLTIPGSITYKQEVSQWQMTK